MRSGPPAPQRRTPCTTLPESQSREIACTQHARDRTRQGLLWQRTRQHGRAPFEPSLASGGSRPCAHAWLALTWTWAACGSTCTPEHEPPDRCGRTQPTRAIRIEVSACTQHSWATHRQRRPRVGRADSWQHRCVELYITAAPVGVHRACNCSTTYIAIAVRSGDSFRTTTACRRLKVSPGHGHTQEVVVEPHRRPVPRSLIRTRAVRVRRLNASAWPHFAPLARGGASRG